MAKTTLTLDIDYDPDQTDPEELACAMDRLLETALSTPGILDDYGNPRIGEFFVLEGDDGRSAGDDCQVIRRWVLYHLDTDALLTTRVYASYEDADDDASHVNDVLVLPLVCRGVTVGPADQPDPDDPKEPNGKRRRQDPSEN
jgi:hypothetical protein